VPGAKVVTDATGRLFYDKIDVLRGGMSFRFLLIPLRSQDTKRIPTFYMMQNKVAFGQFRRFAARDTASYACPTPDRLFSLAQWFALARFKANSNEWFLGEKVGGDYPKEEYPVFNVSVEDAWQLARWLNGNLPTVSQWDKAAGRFESPPAEGPFKEPWDPLDPLQIAVRRRQQGPRPCGTATRDESCFSCRDMAGNGREWTRNLDVTGLTVPQPMPSLASFVILRGRSFRANEPLRFRDLAEEESMDNVSTESYRKLGADLGFRVVIEP
jgi:hypothetical protein